MPDNTEATLELQAAFRRALATYLRESDNLIRGCGLTAQQYAAMLAIATAPARHLSVAGLADAMLLTHHAAVELSQRMAAAGLLTRTPDPSDGRRVVLRLTRDGRARVERCANQHAVELHAARDDLVASLSGLNQRLDPRRPA